MGQSSILSNDLMSGIEFAYPYFRRQIDCLEVRTIFFFTKRAHLGKAPLKRAKSDRFAGFLKQHCFHGGPLGMGRSQRQRAIRPFWQTGHFLALGEGGRGDD